MKATPRNISRSTLVVLLALVFCSASQPISAQQRGRNRPQPTPQTQNLDAEGARRAKALALLIETADDARTLDDLFYRARLQALAADALWPFDRLRARATFRRAWEAAIAFDKAERQEAAQYSGEPLEAIEQMTGARDDVLSKTAARDSSLADIFLRELAKDMESESTEGQGVAGRPKSSSEMLSEMGMRRLTLGYEMIERGDVESAFKLVAPVTGEGVHAFLIFFFMKLNERDAAQGDAFYRLLIAQMRKDALADANTVLLLSTPIISPQLIIMVDQYGSLQFRPVSGLGLRTTSPPAFVPATRRAFFSAAAAVLLRPAAPPHGASEAQDKSARYFAIGRLLPLYEREAAQYVPELRARMNALLNEFNESRRASLSSQLDLRAIGDPPSTDPLRSHFEELGRATEPSEREHITIRIVLVATRIRAWDRARRAAAELNDANVRRAANSFIAVNQIADILRAYRDEKEDNYEEIVEFLKSVTTDVPPVAAAWGYAQAARVAARKKDPQRVAELLTEAEHYAERVDASTHNRVAAYGVIVTQAAALDRGRAWELLTQSVKAANALADYAGDEGFIEIRTDESATIETQTPFTLTADVFRLDSIFATMAHLDFERALSNARALDSRAPRAFAQLAIARAILEKQNSGVRIQKPE